MTTFEGIILGRTARGVLFQSYYWSAPLWFPSSQAEIQEDEGLSVVFQVKDWLCNKKGLLEFTPYSEAEIKVLAGN